MVLESNRGESKGTSCEKGTKDTKEHPEHITYVLALPFLDADLLSSSQHGPSAMDNGLDCLTEISEPSTSSALRALTGHDDPNILQK